MAKSYVLIETSVGYAKAVVDALAEVRQVRSIERVTGPYDAIVVLEAQDINAISDIVVNEIHTLRGVTRTTTCFALHTESNGRQPEHGVGSRDRERHTVAGAL